jgi:hypothetical protein
LQATATAFDQFGSHALEVKSTGLACAPLLVPIHCLDGVTSGDESDVDCGGSCQVCPILSDCTVNSDCAIGNCLGSACIFPSCADGALNGGESDDDCGGTCAGCAPGRACTDGDDCASGFCDAGACAACGSNGDCDVDEQCDSGACEPLVGEACMSGATCPSGFCVDGVCCDTACSGSCEACSFAKKHDGEDGTCGAIAAGTDPDAECAGTDVCVGTCTGPLAVGSSSVAIPRSDSCADAQGRSCESLIGDVVADAMRIATGADFAISNSGALRADLTCPAGGNASCDPYTPPPHVITGAEVLEVLPFANPLAVATVSGDVLKLMLENGVSLAPASAARFPQVSGLCVTYDVASAAGSRVLNAVLQAIDGSCTGGVVDLTVSGSYDIAMNSFMAGGGDGYPNLLYSSTQQGSDWQSVVDYLAVESPLSPSLQGRVTCTDSNGATAPNCPP